MKKELKDQAKEILKLAQNYGVEQNLFFVTTLTVSNSAANLGRIEGNN